jgi:AcrR family transcriptional regulator
MAAMRGRGERGAASPRAAQRKARRRLPPDQRERLIADAAVRFFAERGFSGQTRELARRLGITQPLLYRYFPSKDALIERVYREVFIDQWNPEWPRWLADRSVPLKERLIRFYQAYGRMVLRPEWIRLFLFAGLRGLDLNARFLEMLRERVFARVIAELRHARGLPSFAEVPMTETEVELIWSLHAGIFYIGTRRWIYGLDVPRDTDALIAAKVEAFLVGAPAIIAATIADAPRRQRRRN